MTRLPLAEYAMTVAEAARTRSEDPHRKVGTCLMRHDHTIAALGYNGAPPGVEIDWSDRDARRSWVIHAEANALRYAVPGEIELLASTLMPCGPCMLLIAGYGIKRVVYKETLDPSVYDAADIMLIAEACGITVEQVKEGSR